MNALSQILITHLRDFFTKNNKQKAVLGMSGGVDSSVVAALATQALGTENIIAFSLPHQDFSSEDHKNDAREVADQFGISLKTIDIAPLCQPFFDLQKQGKKMTLGNIMARVRMITLYAAANENDALVLGTGNKTELLTGFFTKWGDGAVDIEVLGNLWKTEVFALAKELKLPPNIYTKPPTAELFLGHTDEEEMGISYPELDTALQEWEKNSHKTPETEAEKIAFQLVKNSEHKRGEVPALSQKIS